MAPVNTINSDEKLNQSISHFEHSMDDLSRRLGELRHSIERRMDHVKEVVHKPREWADRTDLEIRSRPILYLGLACIVGLALGFLSGKSKKESLLFSIED